MSLLSAQNLLRGKTTFWCSNYCFPLQTSNWRSMLHFKTHWFTISLAFLLKCFLSRVYFYFILKSLRSCSWILHPRERGLEISKRKIHIRRERSRGMQIRCRRVVRGKGKWVCSRDKFKEEKIKIYVYIIYIYFKSQSPCWMGRNEEIQREEAEGRVAGGAS